MVTPSVARTRRAFLTAAAGAAAATVASAIEGPSTALAGTDGDVVLGAENTTSTLTKITCQIGTLTVGGTAFQAELQGGGPLSVAMSAVNGGEGNGVWGQAPVGIGARGTVGSGTGVLGEVTSGTGARGYSFAGIGVVGHSGSVVGGTVFTSIGVHGWAAQTSSSCGVNGESSMGRGVRGRSETGVGVLGEASDGIGVRAVTINTGTALQVIGKAALSRSGRTSVRAGRSSVDVNLTPKGGLAGSPLCFANLQRFVAGVFVAAVRPNYPSSGLMRIYLNKTVSSSTPIAWVVLS